MGASQSERWLRPLYFLLPLLLYAVTLRRGVPWWDGGELCVCGRWLDVGHPPGSPLTYLLLRVATLIGSLFGASELGGAACATACNVCGAAAVAAAAGLLGLLARDLFGSPWAGLVAALAWAALPSVRGVAVDVEVYGFAADLAFGALLAAKRGRTPLVWLLTGLAAAVHPLAWLTLPATGALMCKRRPALGGALGTIAIPILYWLGSGHYHDAGLLLDVFGANVLGWPIGLGLCVAAWLWPALLLALSALLGGAGREDAGTNPGPRSLLSRGCLAAFLLSLGFATQTLTLVRGVAHPTLSIGGADNAQGFVDHLSRLMYGDRPLLRGATQASHVVDAVSEPYWRRAGHIYVADERVVALTYDTVRWLPRMSDAEVSRAANAWAGRQPDDTTQPTLAEQITFLARYQLGHMMLRYVDWNVGSRVLWCPLLLALVGLVALCRRRRWRLLLWLAGLWVMAGPLLALALNMPAGEPRERDYIYILSLSSLSLLMGAAVSALPGRQVGLTGCLWLLVTLLAGVGVPLARTWRDYDRSGDRLPELLATSRLRLCPPGAVLVSRSDNQTYPLWATQRLLGERADVEVVDGGLLGNAWYRGAGHDVAAVVVLPATRDTLTLADVQRGYDYCYLRSRRLRLRDSLVVELGKSLLSAQDRLLLSLCGAGHAASAAHDGGTQHNGTASAKANGGRSPARSVCFLPGAVPDGLGLRGVVRDAGPISYLGERVTPERLSLLLRCVELPDASHYTPDADDGRELRASGMLRLVNSVAGDHLRRGETAAALRLSGQGLAWQPPGLTDDDTCVVRTLELLSLSGEPRVARRGLSELCYRLSERLRRGETGLEAVAWRAAEAARRTRNDDLANAWVAELQALGVARPAKNDGD